MKAVVTVYQPNLDVNNAKSFGSDINSANITITQPMLNVDGSVEGGVYVRSILEFSNIIRGRDATINGVNSLNLVAGEGVEIEKISDDTIMVSSDREVYSFNVNENYDEDTREEKPFVLDGVTFNDLFDNYQLGKCLLLNIYVDGFGQAQCRLYSFTENEELSFFSFQLRISFEGFVLGAEICVYEDNSVKLFGEKIDWDRIYNAPEIPTKLSQLDNDIDISNIESGTTEYWNNRIGYIPRLNSIIVYTDYDVVVEDGVSRYVPNIKIGTGNAYVQDLVFVNDGVRERVLNHISDNVIHITEQERELWNSKLNLSEEIINETLVFTRS